MRILLPVLLLLAACGEKFDEPANFDGQPRCGAENYFDLLGKREAVLNDRDLPKSVRILHPDDVITMDFSPDRLTIDIDTSGLISSVTCR